MRKMRYKLSIIYPTEVISFFSKGLHPDWLKTRIGQFAKEQNTQVNCIVSSLHHFEEGIVHRVQIRLKEDIYIAQQSFQRVKSPKDCAKRLEFVVKQRIRVIYSKKLLRYYAK